ncbi:MAG TPA: hypothetical protein VK509_10840, partial [Polyangiales bacterium]|nr:hypothetical protein [Polyangiales bacterium]
MIVCWLVASSARAQSVPVPPDTAPAAPGTPDAGSSVPSTAPAVPPAVPELRSPRIVQMPNVNVPPELVLPPDGSVELLLTVAADGSAQVEACGASEAVCALIGEALEGAQIEPALRAGQPIAARIRVALRLAHAPPPAATNAPSPPAQGEQPAISGRSPTAVPPARPQLAVTPETAPPPVASFEATGRVKRAQPGMRRLELAEMRDLPGALGDPFRAVDALPGVVPALSGLPYFFVRGSPPASTLNIYDDIPVPTLYHLGVLGAVIHPRMVGPIRLYSGVAPARYGRLTGGVVVGEGPEAPDGRLHAEAELRLLDVSAFVQAPALGGTVTAAVRYGYPALLLSIFSPDVDLAYWDYQLRFNGPLSDHDRFELVALGSYDSLSADDEDDDDDGPSNDTRISFHRMEPRLIRRIGSTEYGVALLLGWEQSAFGEDFRLQATRVSPR